MRHADADGNADGDTYTNANADSYGHGYSNSNSYSDGHGYSNSHSHSHSHGDSHSHSHSHGDSNSASCVANPDGHAQTYADAQAAADESSAGRPLSGTLKGGNSRETPREFPA